jgi:tetratricopeptide (TPR) repeat protein
MYRSSPRPRPTRVALLALTFLAAGAQAQPKNRKLEPAEKQAARALYDDGVRHYNVAQYEAAIEAFKQAYLISGDPHLLFDVAQSYRLKGDCEQALRFYRNFLRESPKAAEAAQVEAAIARCETPPAATAPPVPAPAVIQPPPPAPPAVAAAPPPPPALRPAEPVVERSAPVPPEAGRRKRVAGVAVAIAGAAVAGTGVVLGLTGRARSQELSRHEGEWSHTEKRAEESARRLGTAGQILTGAGATAVVAGVVLYLVGASERRSASGVSVAVSPGEGGVWWTSSF